MGRKEYLIDTNVAIEYLGETLPEQALTMLDDLIDGHFSVSVINKIELLGFADISKNEELRFQEFLNAAHVIGLDEHVVDSTIKIRKQYKIKLPDAIIAATALENDLTIITRNTKDFIKIKGIEVLHPSHI